MGWIIDLADGGGGVQQRVVVPPDSPFSNAAAVAVFYSTQANRDDWLRNSVAEGDAVLTVIVVDDNTGFPDAASGVNTYQWGGADQATAYDITNWVIYQGLNAAEIKELLESNSNTNTVTDEEKGFLETTREYSGNNYLLSGTPKVESGSLLIGDIVKLKNNSNFLGIEYTNDVSPNNLARIPEYLTPSNSRSGKVRRFSNTSGTGNEDVFPINPTPTGLSSPLNFDVTSSVNSDVTVQSFEFNALSAITNFRIRISDSSNNVLIYFPNERSWIDEAGGVNFPAGNFNVDFSGSTFLISGNSTYSVSIRFSTGQLSNAANPNNNLPFMRWFRQGGLFVNLQDELRQFTSSSATVNALSNSAFTLNLLNNDITLNLNTNALVGDIVRVQAITNIGTNTLTVNGGSPNSINVQRADGTVQQDQTVTTQQSRPLDFIWTSGGWFIYNF